MQTRSPGRFTTHKKDFKRFSVVSPDGHLTKEPGKESYTGWGRRVEEGVRESQDALGLGARQCHRN